MAARIIVLLAIVLFINGCSDSPTCPEPPAQYTCLPAIDDSAEVVLEGEFVDFALAEADGTYHIIGIDGHNTDWITITEGDTLGFVHYTSPDMETWTRHSNIREPLLDHEYSADHIWAPSIIDVDGLYYMFYTGVKRGVENNQNDNEQRIMLSTSDDLFNWSDPVFVLDGTSPLTAWGSGEPWANDCRDPHVFKRDDGSYGMVVSLKNAENTCMFIGLAESDDLFNWEIVEAVKGTGLDYPFRPPSYWSTFAESAFYLEHLGNEYVFWTANDGRTPITDPATGLSFFGIGGKACEILPKGDGTYWYTHLSGNSGPGFNITISTLYFECEED